MQKTYFLQVAMALVIMVIPTGVAVWKNQAVVEAVFNTRFDAFETRLIEWREQRAKYVDMTITKIEKQLGNLDNKQTIHLRMEHTP